MNSFDRGSENAVSALPIRGCSRYSFSTMKSKIFAIVLVTLFTVVVNIHAQDPPPSAAETAEHLRAQLFEVQTKEDELRARAQQLDEALKPENIERSLAGVGSTRPEELRETRRKQLQIERDGVQAQLNLLETTRTRLEAAIRDAEVRAYHESAGGVQPTKMVLSQSMFGRRLLYSGSATVAVVGLVAGFIIRRRLRKRNS